MPKYAQEIKNLLLDGCTSTEIQQRLGVGKGLIFFHAGRLGIGHRKLKRYDWKAISNYIASGHTQEDCEKFFGMSKSTIQMGVRHGCLVLPRGVKLIGLKLIGEALKERCIRLKIEGKLLREISTDTGVGISTLWNWIKNDDRTSSEYNTKSPNKINKISENILRNAVENSVSIRECLRQMGICPEGGNSTRVKKLIDDLGINRSHFTGQACRKGIPPTTMMSVEQLIVRGNGNPSRRGTIRAAILREKLIPYECRECGLDEWKGKPLTLNLDHIDGDNGNHALSNLRFLCPNCDSQQPTFGSKNRGRKKELAALRVALKVE